MAYLGRQRSDQRFELFKLLHDARLLLCVQLLCHQGIRDLLQCVVVPRLEEHGILRRMHGFILRDCKIHAVLLGFPLKVPDAGISQGHARNALILSDQLFDCLFPMHSFHFGRLLRSRVPLVLEIHADSGNDCSCRQP